MATDVPFSLITTVPYDPALESADWNSGSPWLLRNEHLGRLRKSAQALGWETTVKAIHGEEGDARFRTMCETAVTEYLKTGQAPVAIRFTLDKAGVLKYTTRSYERRPYGHYTLSRWNPTMQVELVAESLFEVTLDTMPTPASIFTRHKTTYRPHYSEARARAGIVDFNDRKEVILFNEGGEVAECTLCNVFFWRDGVWVTPTEASGCLPGLARRWMVEQGGAVEAVIQRGEVRHGELVLLSNALYMLQVGRVSLH